MLKRCSHLWAKNSVLLPLLLHGSLRLGDGCPELVSILQSALTSVHTAGNHPQGRAGTLRGFGVGLDTLANVRQVVRHPLVLRAHLHAGTYGACTLYRARSRYFNGHDVEGDGISMEVMPRRLPV